MAALPTPLRLTLALGLSLSPLATGCADPPGPEAVAPAQPTEAPPPPAEADAAAAPDAAAPPAEPDAAAPPAAPTSTEARSQQTTASQDREAAQRLIQQAVDEQLRVLPTVEGPSSFLDASPPAVTDVLHAPATPIEPGEGDPGHLEPRRAPAP